jgi:hypothetical protein
VKKKQNVSVEVYIQEKKTRVVPRVIRKSIWIPGGCFSHGHWETRTESVNITESYTENVPQVKLTEIEVSEAILVPKTVRKNYPRKVMKSVPVIEKKATTKMVTRQVEMKCKKTKVVPILIGFRILTFNVIRKGRRIRNWEVSAPWSEIEWDESQTMKTLDNEKFEPCAEAIPILS